MIVVFVGLTTKNIIIGDFSFEDKEKLEEQFKEKFKVVAVGGQVVLQQVEIEQIFEDIENGFSTPTE